MYNRKRYRGKNSLRRERRLPCPYNAATPRWHSLKSRHPSVTQPLQSAPSLPPIIRLYSRYLKHRRCMIGIMKSLYEVFQTVLAGVPETLRVVLEFVWKARWFLIGLWVSLVVYSLVTKVLPFLMWTWVIKSIVGSVFSFL
jgi:hypothetical protein